MRVVVVDLRTDNHWEAYLASHSDGLIDHHHGWTCAFEKECGRACITFACEETSGRLYGILPLMTTYGALGPWRLSHPASHVLAAAGPRHRPDGNRSRHPKSAAALREHEFYTDPS